MLWSQRIATSRLSARASPPAERPVMNTRAPSSASTAATPRPTPKVAPVTRATRLLRRAPAMMGHCHITCPDRRTDDERRTTNDLHRREMAARYFTELCARIEGPGIQRRADRLRIGVERRDRREQRAGVGVPWRRENRC